MICPSMDDDKPQKHMPKPPTRSPVVRLDVGRCHLQHAATDPYPRPYLVEKIAVSKPIVLFHFVPSRPICRGPVHHALFGRSKWPPSPPAPHATALRCPSTWNTAHPPAVSRHQYRVRIQLAKANKGGWGNSSSNSDSARTLRGPPAGMPEQVFAVLLAVRGSEREDKNKLQPDKAVANPWLL
ncbi:hypothetical protein LX36DRAFT_332301 [Colletotrichum falcatum]|nr:hypothetical protein LX36DRAFT_332301 [Colletotrichum falcatum]